MINGRNKYYQFTQNFPSLFHETKILVFKYSDIISRKRSTCRFWSFGLGRIRRGTHYIFIYEYTVNC